ncbi:hypothetical protein F7734_54770 [Scytonema sp. UIC 10036]|uniref:helix-turn-helix domain-containing protein n=1 Tax=Scytonema sp. UIC 10036 TaxID=2304196 RepID=UPI0012DA85AB|nr:helix-turn-helix transcriptional regulator [Scytonema sp. UIC 10036]MUH00860.1 hypothetical protein [Scytonema sp. UIC 10036]
MSQDSNNALRQKLIDEIVEYETLVTHPPTNPLVLEISDMNDLPNLLIKARIAFKLTQQELAVLSDRTPAQIKAFEEKNYHNASFLDFLTISKVLGIQIINGEFVAQIDDFYKQELMNVRQEANLDISMKALLDKGVRAIIKVIPFTFY